LRDQRQIQPQAACEVCLINDLCRWPEKTV
jgi:hypothetical protein